MPPKTKFSKEQILDAAFDIANKSGFDSITIRKVADNLGASIAPIYVNFKNLDELKFALGEKISDMVTEVLLSVKTHDPFLDIGAGNIKLAMDYSVLYRDMHLNPNTKQYFKHYEHHMKMIKKMSGSDKLNGLNEKQMGDVLHIMAFVTEGIIFSILTDRKNMTYEEMLIYLEDVADDVIAGYKINKGVTE